MKSFRNTTYNPILFTNKVFNTRSFIWTFPRFFSLLPTPFHHPNLNSPSFAEIIENKWIIFGKFKNYTYICISKKGKPFKVKHLFSGVLRYPPFFAWISTFPDLPTFLLRDRFPVTSMATQHFLICQLFFLKKNIDYFYNILIIRYL